MALYTGQIHLNKPGEQHADSDKAEYRQGYKVNTDAARLKILSHLPYDNVTSCCCKQTEELFDDKMGGP